MGTICVEDRKRSSIGGIEAMVMDNGKRLIPGYSDMKEKYLIIKDIIGKIFLEIVILQQYHRRSRAVWSCP